MNLKTNPELLPLIEWWEKDGKQTVIYLAIAAVAVGGWYGFKHHRIAVRTAARDALVNTFTAEEMEEACSKFSGTPTAGALKLRLAKKYYDDGKFAEAMATYEELIAKPVEGFADIPVVGKAQCLEALGKFAEAQKAFDDFAAANPKNYLTLTAQLGAARALCQAGDKKAALARIDALKKANESDEISKARVEATELAIKRYEKKVPAPAVEPKKEDPKKAEAKPAAAPTAKPAAPAAPAAKPAPAPAKPAEAKK